MKLTFVLSSAAPDAMTRAPGREAADEPGLGADDDEIAALCAAALAERGHEVTLLGAGPGPAWLPAASAYRDLLRQAESWPRQDLVLVTGWRSIAAARSLRAGPVTHLCHRFEGHLATSDREAAAIDRAYSMVPAGLAVSPQLAGLLEHRYGRTSHVVELPAESGFRSGFRWRPRRARTILLSAAAGDPRGLEAVRIVAARLARASAPAAKAAVLVASPSPAGEGESPVALWPRREYARALRRCDVALLAQHAPLLRLLQCAASGVPMAILDGGPCAELARRERLEGPAADSEALLHQADALLRSGSAWRSLRGQGFALARRHRGSQVAALLERAVGELALGLD